jgi:transposase-like protein
VPPIERTFSETRHRTKVIGRLPRERICVALVFAVLDRRRKSWRGMTMTPRALRRLQDLRHEFLGDQLGVEPDDIITAAA